MSQTNIQEESHKKKKSLRQQIPSIIVLLALSLMATSYWLNQMILPSLRENQTVLQEKQDLLAARELELRRIQDLSRIVDELDRRTKQTIEAVPTQEEIPELLFQLGAIADELNLTTNQLAITPNNDKSPKTANASTIGISLSFSGNYEDIVNYLYSIENLIRLTNISRLSISGDDTFESLDRPLTVSLQGVAYFSQ